MALDDKDIFNAICNLNAGQPIDMIMAQYEKAKRMNMEIERRSMSIDDPELEAAHEPASAEMEIVEEILPPKKKYTRRQLRVKPQDAITEDAIFCCICGEERQSLTAKHLATHDITVEEYKKLCGYPSDQPLMSGRRLAKSKEIIARAQQARLDKRASQREE